MKAKLLFTLLLAFATFSLSSCNDDVDEYKDKSSTQLNRENKEAGEKFLDENRNAEGVHETYTGLQYSIISNGNGPVPTENDSVTISYTGQLLNNTVFCDIDSFKVLLSEEFEGLREGVCLMKEGSEYKFFIPYYLAFGSNSKAFAYNSKTVTVRPYSLVIYNIKLEKVTSL